MAKEIKNTASEILAQNAIMDSSISAKLVFDNETLDILHVNSAIAEILGYTEDELTRLKLNDIIADDFSIQIDNEFVTFPAEKLTRKFISKNGNIIYCLSENCDVDFDCSAMLIHTAKPERKVIGLPAIGSGILVDNAYASIVFNTNYSNN